MSPLREEKEPLLKVNRKLNVWYDHGFGKGGNLIDFAMLYDNCSFKELLEKMKDVFSFHLQTSTVQQPLPASGNPKEALEPAIKVIAAKPLTNPTLCRYLNDRKVSLEIAQKYCKEVDFEMYGKQYFAVGFENKSGGFERRNRYLKGRSPPKDVTIAEINNAKDRLFLKVLSAFFLFKPLSKKTTTLTNFLVLNSLSFFEKSRQLMEEHRKINPYLDRDNAGIKNTQSA